MKTVDEILQEIDRAILNSEFFDASYQMGYQCALEDLKQFILKPSECKHEKLEALDLTDSSS